MAILAECPVCKTKQSIKNKRCSYTVCNRNLDSAKKANRVRYWIRYRLPDGKQKTELAKGKDVSPYSIEDARAVHSKRVVEKREGRVFNVTDDTRKTFNEFVEWYLNHEDVKSSPSYRIIKIRLGKVKKEIGHKIVADIQPDDLRNFRAKLEKQNLSDSYIDDVIVAGKTVINRAFENGMVGVSTYRRWKSIKKVLSVGDNARDRVITVEEYEALQKAKGQKHVKNAIAIQYWTGLRPNDVLALELDQIDLRNRILTFEVKRRRTQKPKPAQVYIVDELFDQVFSKLKKVRAIGEDRHVIQFRGRPVESVKTAFKTLCDEAKIPYGRRVKNGITLHDFRHTSITDMRRAGVNPLVNKIWHGHSSRREAHSGYHTVDQEDLRRAGEMLQDYRRKLREEVRAGNVTKMLPETKIHEA